MGSDLSTIEKMDMEFHDKWEIVTLSKQDNWNPTQNMGVVQISNNEILVFGGMRGGKPLSESLIYSVSENCFWKCSNMLNEDTFLQVKPKKTFSCIYAFGGHKMDLHIFNLRSKAWDLIPMKAWVSQDKK